MYLCVVVVDDLELQGRALLPDRRSVTQSAHRVGPPELRAALGDVEIFRQLHTSYIHVPKH